MKRLWLICLVMLAFCVCGCGSKEVTQKEVQEHKVAYEVIDEGGRKHIFDEKPQRIVSLSYGTDEILTELVDAKRIASYCRWAEDPGITFITKEQYKKVGRKTDGNAEEVLALKPDLVLATTAMSSDIINALDALGLKVYLASRPKNYEQMRQKVLKLGEAVGEKAKGEALVRQMDERMDKLEAKLSQIPDSKRKTVVAFNFLSAMGRKGDLIDSMMNKAHIINGVAQIPTELATGYISKEQVVRVNPDIFFLATWDYDNKHNVDEYVAQIKNDPAYKDVKAIKNNQIKFVSDKYRYVASHHIVDAVEEFAKAVYPELFRGDET